MTNQLAGFQHKRKFACAKLVPITTRRKQVAIANILYYDLHIVCIMLALISS